MMDEREEEQDINYDQIDDEDIPQGRPRKIYRLLSILLILSMIFAFVLPPLINSLGFLHLFTQNDLEPQEVQELLGHFEDTYLYQELFEKEIYHQKKEQLLSRNAISQMRFHLFIKDVTNHVGDEYTYFSIDTSNTKSPNVSVENQVINEELFYIRLRTFHEGITEKTKESLSSSTQSNLIIDLRGNPGGDLRELLRIAELFLPEHLEIFRLEGSNEVQFFMTREEIQYPFEQIFIFLDHKSASAAEILALTMKLHMDNVVLIGKETVGKSVAQTEQKSSNGAYSFSIVSSRWSVQNQSVEDLQSYLSAYEGIKLNSLDDYIAVVNGMIR